VSDYGVVQTRRFARQYKKLHDNFAADVDQAVAAVAAAPESGERKKGDLAALRVVKFRSQGQLYLLGYTLDDVVLLVYLEAVGPHENFYRDLKRN
jgi:mRNA-degrading endonuclease RelE of RelBE toxin-antitoxin system